MRSSRKDPHALIPFCTWGHTVRSYTACSLGVPITGQPDNSSSSEKYQCASATVSDYSSPPFACFRGSYGQGRYSLTDWWRGPNPRTGNLGVEGLGRSGSPTLHFTDGETESPKGSMPLTTCPTHQQGSQWRLCAEAQGRAPEAFLPPPHLPAGVGRIDGRAQTRKIQTIFL